MKRLLLLSLTCVSFTYKSQCGAWRDFFSNNKTQEEIFRNLENQLNRKLIAKAGRKVTLTIDGINILNK